MKFTSDNQPKNRGRKKGSQDKATKAVKEAFCNLLYNNIDTLQDDLKALEPKDRLRFIIDLSKFIIPTLRASDVSVTNDAETTILIDFLEADDSTIENKLRSVPGTKN